MADFFTELNKMGPTLFLGSNPEFDTTASEKFQLMSASKVVVLLYLVCL